MDVMQKKALRMINGEIAAVVGPTSPSTGKCVHCICSKAGYYSIHIKGEGSH